LGVHEIRAGLWLAVHARRHSLQIANAGVLARLRGLEEEEQEPPRIAGKCRCHCRDLVIHHVDGAWRSRADEHRTPHEARPIEQDLLRNHAAEREAEEVDVRLA